MMANTDRNKRMGRDGKHYMKMKELSQITGVKAPTIRYYITQGILPKPHKPHKNIAYYDESYVELIRLVKKFQKEYFLPLEVIKKAIDDLGHDNVTLMESELTDKLFQAKQMDWMEPAPVNNLVKPVDKRTLINVSKISSKDLEKCVKIGALTQDENGCFNVQDVRLASLVAQVREYLSDERGFAFDFITTHNDFIRKMVEEEFQYFFSRIIKGEVTIPVANDLAVKSIEILYLMFPIIHKRYLNKKIKEALHIE